MRKSIKTFFSKFVPVASNNIDVSTIRGSGVISIGIAPPGGGKYVGYINCTPSEARRLAGVLMRSSDLAERPLPVMEGAGAS